MNKDLYPEHMKKTYKSTIRKQATQQKGTKDLDRDFTKDSMEMENKHMK